MDFERRQVNDPRINNFINAYPTPRNANRFQNNQPVSSNTVPTASKAPYPITEDANEVLNQVPYFSPSLAPAPVSRQNPILDPKLQGTNTYTMHSNFQQNPVMVAERSPATGIPLVSQDRGLNDTPQASYDTQSNNQSYTSSNKLQNSATQAASQLNSRPDQSKQEKSSITKNRDISSYSQEAILFFEVYSEAVKDGSNFTPAVQMKWCETLLEYAYKDDFITHYNINAEKLKRALTSSEVVKNQKVIIEHAFKILNKLIAKKYSDAIYLMGTLYSHQCYLRLKNKNIVERDDEKAFEIYCIAARLQHSDSCYRAGISYEFNRGVSEQQVSRGREYMIKKAIEFYEKGAIECSNKLCMYKLGMCYLHGLHNNIDTQGNRIIEPSIKAAINWFEKSSNSQSIYELAKLYEYDNLPIEIKSELSKISFQKDSLKALGYYNKSATEFNNSLSQYKLGYCYESGDLGLPIDGSKSISWYFKSSTNNNAMSMLALGGWYFTGCPGVLNQNDLESFNWTLRSCNASDGKFGKAEYILGYYYENGIGCDVDLNKARTRYELASKLGYEKAIERLRNLNA